MTNATDDLEEAIERFVRDTRGVYEEYEDGYIDPDAALWTIEGHIDRLETRLESSGDDQ
jgi:hypothetical protein